MASQAALGQRALPTRVDRYPAKMVSHLAERLVARYARGGERLLDPFCGSGAVLAAAQRQGIASTGLDVNPYAVLLARVKTSPVSAPEAAALCGELVARAGGSGESLPMVWGAKEYWFTTGTLAKYERLRAAARAMRLGATAAGRAVLLALALSARACSRADQRSPKPFISKYARATRSGRHFDPYQEVPALLHEFLAFHARQHHGARSRILATDVAREPCLPARVGVHTHVVTSPPYVNAQDYYRNSKLELAVLEGVLPFSMAALAGKFIGTERGDLSSGVDGDTASRNRGLVPALSELEGASPRHAQIVHRYLADMRRAIGSIGTIVPAGGVLVVVCGDNLVGGRHIPTWRVLATILEEAGFEQFDSFTDRIAQRMVPPRRVGHKGLIKEEHIMAFRRLSV